MERNNARPLFGEQQAAEYDKRFIKLAALKDALHLLLGAIFGELPEEARILCVGAGTGAEIGYLAERFPGWQFMAVDPSAPMLEVCRRRVAEMGVADRCEFHVGYVDSLPAGEPFDGATSLLVSQFILQREARRDFFRQIARRLRPGGMLASTDLAGAQGTANYDNLLETWLRLMRFTDITDEQVEGMRRAYARDVAIWPVEEVSEIIASAGFESPTRFYQAGMIHGWYARRRAD